MKIERSSATRPARAVGAAAYARQAEAVQAATTVSPIPATASILGIPEAEFTPRVRDAIMTLMGEVDSLRRDINQMRARLEDAEKTADQDQLLPLLNRRAFVRELMRHIAHAARYNTPASLIYFDLDNFKQINDTYGHAGGDVMLAHFADTLLANVRDSDVVGRVGGDEFGVLLSHASQDQAHMKADLLADQLRASPVDYKGTKIIVKFSYGAFELKPGDDADLAMARADEAMYAHKRSAGR